MTCLTVAIVAWQDITKLGLHNNLWFVTFLTINNNAPLIPSNRIYPTTIIRNDFTSLFSGVFPNFSSFLCFLLQCRFPGLGESGRCIIGGKNTRVFGSKCFVLVFPLMLIDDSIHADSTDSIDSWFQDLYEIRCLFISLFLSLLQVDSWFQGQVSTSEYWMVEKHTS